MNRDPNRRFYVLQCVDDIKLKSHCVLPAIKHLHAICKSFSRGNTIYQKADKQTLGDLNKQHEIVKLLSISLKHCHQLAVKEALSARTTLKPETVIEHRYSHAEHVEGHLDLLKFLLKEGDLYLRWERCQVLWETMILNQDAIDYDRYKELLSFIGRAITSHTCAWVCMTRPDESFFFAARGGS